jgi:hypothetical protein
VGALQRFGLCHGIWPSFKPRNTADVLRTFVAYATGFVTGYDHHSNPEITLTRVSSLVALPAIDNFLGTAGQTANLESKHLRLNPLLRHLKFVILVANSFTGPLTCGDKLKSHFIMQHIYLKWLTSIHMLISNGRPCNHPLGLIRA